MKTISKSKAIANLLTTLKRTAESCDDQVMTALLKIHGTTDAELENFDFSGFRTSVANQMQTATN